MTELTSPLVQLVARVAATSDSSAPIHFSVAANPLCPFRRRFGDVFPHDLSRERVRGVRYGYLPFLNILFSSESRSARRICATLLPGESLLARVYWTLMQIPFLHSILTPYFVYLSRDVGDMIRPSTGALITVFDFKKGHVRHVVKEGFDAQPVWHSIARRNEIASLVRTPRILHSDERRGFFTEELVVGERLFHRINRTRLWPALTEAYDQLAQAYTPLTEMPAHTYIDRLMHACGALRTHYHMPSEADFFDSVGEGAQRYCTAHNITTFFIVPVHGDFHLENLIVARGRVTVLDWEYARDANVLHDLINVTAQAYINYGSDELLSGLLERREEWKSLLARAERAAGRTLSPEYLYSSTLLVVLEILAHRAHDERYKRNPQDFARIVRRARSLYERIACTVQPQEQPSLTSRVFAALAHNDISYCVTKHYPSSKTTGDIDVLITPADRAHVHTLLDKEGFRVNPNGLWASSWSYYAYDETNREWVVFDIHTEAGRFRRFYKIPGLERRFLEHSTVHNGVRIMSPANEAIFLSLQMLGGFGKKTYSERIRTLLTDEQERNAFIDFWRTWLPRPTQLLEHITAHDETAIITTGRAVRAKVFRRYPATCLFWLVRDYVTRFSLALTKRFVYRTGITIALLGTDGAGKSTQEERLRGVLPFRTETHYMGWKAFMLPTTSFLERLVLSVQHHPAPARKAVGILFVIGVHIEYLVRFARAYLRLNKGIGIIFDRYPYDLFITPVASPLQRALFRTLFNTFYPRPTCTFLLNAEPVHLHARKSEHDLTHISAQPRAYLDFAAATHIPVLTTTDNPAHTTHELSSHLWRMLRASAPRYLAFK